MAAERTVRTLRMRKVRDAADDDRILIDAAAAIAWLPYLDGSNLAAVLAAHQALVSEALALTDES